MIPGWPTDVSCKEVPTRRKRRFLINMARVAAVALPFVIALVLYVGLNREEEQWCVLL